MKLKIITPKGIYFEGDVNILNVRTIDGQMGIMANHIPFVTILNIGDMNFVDSEGRHLYALAGGVLYVGSGETKVIAEAIESENEIDVDRARRAYERAKMRLEQQDEVDFKRANIALQKAITRIRVAGHDL